MGYLLGVDLGTTFTAAAVYRDRRVEIAPLGNRAPTVPSVVLLKDDGSILAGEAAQRRGLAEPERIAREFKRRVGDPTPIVIGGTPYSAEAVTAKLLRWVVDRVAELEGGPPDGIAVTHPANWGNYKIDLLTQTVRLAGLEQAVMLSEPAAAAAYYASQERVDVGSVIAVYDLGGGTFDAAVLRKTDNGWEILGEPEGIERLGGIDFDEAVFQHVRRSVEPQLRELDLDDPAALSAVARLRQECIDAKEALSTDTDVSISIMLPNVQTEVRLTRSEFEHMIRPTLQDTSDALRRALHSAGVTPDGVSAVLLVGGSSRIPLVAQMVGAEFARPVAVDVHPKHAVALGAALAVAARVGALGAAVVTAADPQPPPQPSTEPPAPALPPASRVAPPADTPAAVAMAPVPTSAAPTSPVPDPPGAAQAPPPSGRRNVLIIGVVAALVALVGIGALVLTNGGDQPPAAADATPTDATTPTSASSTTPSSTPTAPHTTSPSPAVPACDEPCVEITDVRYAPDQPPVEPGNPLKDRYVFTFEPRGFTPSLADVGSWHIHFYWDSTDPRNAGNTGPDPDRWVVWDQPTTVSVPFFNVEHAPDGANAICALIATHSHGVADVDGDAVPDTGTGNCVPLPRE